MPTTWLSFEALFVAGVPLALFALAFERIRGAKRRRLAGIAAVPVFALSSFLAAQAGR